MLITIDDLRRFAVARSLFTPTTLERALHRLGFVQADPIRAPARAQDPVSYTHLDVYKRQGLAISRFIPVIAGSREALPQLLFNPKPSTPFFA